MKYIVIKKYRDAPNKPIKIEVGEKLLFIEESNPKGDWPNWVFCKGFNKEGWIPKQILEIEGSQVTALEKYDASEHNLEIGEIISADKSLNAWVYGVKVDSSDAVLAWAPLNCLKML